MNFFNLYRETVDQFWKEFFFANIIKRTVLIQLVDSQSAGLSPLVAEIIDRVGLPCTARR